MSLVNRLPAGMVATAPFVAPTAVLGLSFGLLAAPVLGTPATMAMSAVVWAGTAQFAVVSVLGAGGGLLTAIGAALLANARFLPMGFAIAPSVTGGWLRRLATGATLADASFAIAIRPGGRVDIPALIWAAPLQWLAWVSGTVVGALSAGSIGDPTRWGLDVIFPVLYLGLLLPDILPPRKATRANSTQAEAPAPTAYRRPLAVAAVAALITLVTTPFAPPGVPILAGATAALIGIRAPTQERPARGGAGTR